MNTPIAHVISTPDGGGYWLVAADGGTFAFGDAGFFGSMGGDHLDAPVVNMAPTRTARLLVGGQGWRRLCLWRCATLRVDGRPHLNAQIVGIAADPQTGGYWLVASDGGIFAFNAPFYGSTGGIRLQQPVNGMTTAAARERVLAGGV